MKRFWLILLSLGLVMAFSVSAFAVDVKFSGDFYAAGVYVNKTEVRDAFLTSKSQHSLLFSETARGERLYRISGPEADHAF